MSQEQRRATETPRWRPYEPCPCGCGVIASRPKLVKPCVRGGCVIGCNSMSCRNRRNQKKGRAGHAKAHRNLGGVGFTPGNEEAARPYEVTVTVLPEVKTGQQIPASWNKFAASEWFRHALSQSARAVPVGSGALPCVVLRGDFAVVDIRGKRQSDIREKGSG